MLAELSAPRRISLLREVATGPSSAVFVARWSGEHAERLAAVKVVRPSEWRQVEALMELRDRGRALAALQHPSLVAGTEVLRVGDYPALASPWLDGVDLLDWVEILRETGTVLPGRVICEMVRDVAKGLDAALNQSPWPDRPPLGLAHGDLKPANVFVGRHGSVVITDFSAGYLSLGGSTARTGALKRGLLKYVSPQRREGGPATSACDIYALGIVAVELFRGRWLRRLRMKNPAHDRHLTEVVATIGRMDMRSTADDQTLRSVLLRMVAHDPDSRPSAPEVAQTFRMLADRASGPSLEHFAHDQLIPWLEPVPAMPAENLRLIEVEHITSEEQLQALPEPAAAARGLLEAADLAEQGFEHQDTGEFTDESPFDADRIAASEDPTGDEALDLLLDTPEPPPRRDELDAATTWNAAIETPVVPVPAVEVEVVSVRSRQPDHMRLVFAVAGLTMGLALGASIMFALAWVLSPG